MSSDSEPMSRRSVLRATTGTIAAAAGAGLASADAGSQELAEYNVGFDGPAGRDRAVDAAEEVRREFAFDALTLRLPEAAVAGLRNNPNVRYVEENGSSSVDAQTLPDGVDRLDAEKIWNAVDGSGIDVAVLDTGVDSDHADLASDLGVGVSFADGCSGCATQWDDEVGHGTSVSGIAGAIDDSSDVVGVAPGVTVHAVEVCSSLTSCSWDAVAAGLEWAADAGYEVANMSLSGGHSDLVAAAVDYADARDLLMVGSAGNDGPCTDCVNYPASDPNVIGVSSYARDGGLSDFSNQGPEIDLTAPGESLETTSRGGGTELFSGTSASAPHVSGAAAIARAVTSSKDEARKLLEGKAEDVGLTFDEQGSGLPDVEAIIVEPWVYEDGFTPGETQATLTGNVGRFGPDASSGQVYFEWGESGQGMPNSTPKQSVSSTGQFSDTIFGLQCQTLYEFRPVLEADDGQVDRGFTTIFSTLLCSGGCSPSTNRICEQDAEES